MSTVAEIVDLINNTELSIEDRVAIVRAVRNTIPDLIAPERRLKGRVDSARGVRPEYIDSAILGLENSALWQQSSSTSPKELRLHRDASTEHRLLFEEAQALADIANYNSRYHHFVGVDKARAVHRVGKQITGDAAVLVQPHLDIMATARPTNGRRRLKPATQPTTPIPPSAKE
jgi:hypothetical protein